MEKWKKKFLDCGQLKKFNKAGPSGKVLYDQNRGDINDQQQRRLEIQNYRDLTKTD